jgi:16S rRNA C967 or C1407 C5-methylase (RsmB/RsmF family)
MLRKSEEARAEWTPESPAICRERQLGILRNAYSILKPGGKLLYSTCTWSIEENEEVVDYLISNFGNIGGSRSYSIIDTYIMNISSAQGDSLAEKTYNYLVGIGVSKSDLDKVINIMTEKR